MPLVLTRLATAHDYRYHTTAQDRLRQIAILISSVDAAAARQILLHLPTDKARQVRALVSQLGNVAPEEKRKILADFQRSAATSANSPASTAASSLRLACDGSTRAVEFVVRRLLCRPTNVRGRCVSTPEIIRLPLGTPQTSTF
ncbi:MAG: hypothetical protein R3C56_01965 [Pirellulaceae bacterium]